MVAEVQPSASMLASQHDRANTEHWQVLKSSQVAMCSVLSHTLATYPGQRWSVVCSGVWASKSVLKRPC